MRCGETTAGMYPPQIGPNSNVHKRFASSVLLLTLGFTPDADLSVMQGLTVGAEAVQALRADLAAAVAVVAAVAAAAAILAEVVRAFSLAVEHCPDLLD
jgi:hypothetical protein